MGSPHYGAFNILLLLFVVLYVLYCFKFLYLIRHRTNYSLAFMDKDALFKTAQSYISTPGLPLLILGSGASMNYGIPGMADLAKELKKIRVTDVHDLSAWKQFLSHIDKYDLETTLLKVQLPESVERLVIERTWEFISAADMKVFREKVVKNEEFPLVELLRYFFRTSNKTVNIITTNYDRIAEYAASISDLHPFTYFLSGYFSSFVGEQDDCFTRAKKCIGVANICKLHGSLDWFAVEAPYLTYRSIPLQEKLLDGCSPCIVTPGLNKFRRTSQTPFRELFQISDDLINKAPSYLCIGYGFNDEHVHPKVLENVTKNKRPLIVITKKLTDNIQKIITLQGAEKILIIEEGKKGGSIVYTQAEPKGTYFPESYWLLSEFLTLITS